MRMNPLAGKCGIEATNSVVSKDPKYMIVAIRLDSWNILRYCVLGPDKKQDPMRAMRLPMVAFKTRGRGFPVAKSLILQKLPKDKMYPAAMQVAHPKSRSRRLISGI